MDHAQVLARTRAFECELQDRCARELHRFEYGSALFDRDLPRVYDGNFVRFERGLEDLTADRVEEAADRLQATFAHRKVVIPDTGAGALAAAELSARGWRLHTLVTLAYGGPRERTPARVGEQVSASELHAAREQSVDGSRHDPDARRQIVAFTERTARVVPSRLLAARAEGGEIGAFCVLLQGGGVGQIDEVTTIERHRRRGLATTVLEGALAASLAAGAQLTFLVADEADWPKEWYERLGFEPVGRRFELLRV